MAATGPRTRGPRPGAEAPAEPPAPLAYPRRRGWRVASGSGLRALGAPPAHVDARPSRRERTLSTRERTSSTRERTSSTRARRAWARGPATPFAWREGPKGVQEGPKGVREGPDPAREGPKGVREGPKGVREGPNGVREGPSAAREGPFAAPGSARWPAPARGRPCSRRCAPSCPPGRRRDRERAPLPWPPGRPRRRLTRRPACAPNPSRGRGPSWLGRAVATARAWARRVDPRGHAGDPPRRPEASAGSTTRCAVAGARRPP